MAITQLNFGRDVQGYNAYAPQDATIKFRATLINGVETNATVPLSNQVWMVAFSPQPGSTVWIDISGGTATLPVGNTLQPTTCSLNPGQRTMLAGQKISMITGNATADVGVSMWPVSYP